MGVFSGLTHGLSNILSDKGAEKDIGGIMNNITGTTGQMDKSYRQQLAAMEKQNAYNTYMWNLQNQYNSPSAQLARMAEAGIEINPTSYALGTGNLSNTASLVGSASGFSGSGSPAGNPVSMLMGVAQGIQSIRESKARTANMEVQNSNLAEVTHATSLENQIRQHNLNIARDTNTPVGNMPSWESVIGQELAGLRDNPKKLILAGLRDNPKKLINRLSPGSRVASWLADKIESIFD